MATVMESPVERKPEPKKEEGKALISRGVRARPLFDPEILKRAIKESFVKLNPRLVAKNPVMFVVEVGAALTTVFVIKDPEASRLPTTLVMHEAFTAGAQWPISMVDILRREMQASRWIHECVVFRILRFLIDAPPFDFATYECRNNPLFIRPQSVYQLPTGLPHATCQYMLDTVHIDEVSYEGNIRCLDEFFRQMGFHSNDGRKQLVSTARVCVGNQMTMSRLRGIHKFRSEDLNSYKHIEFLHKQCGFLHTQLAQENSLHSQYYGTRAGLRLLHAFKLLGRKGLASSSVKGTFHHDIKEALYHIAEARFRDLWCVVRGVENVSDLRS